MDYAGLRANYVVRCSAGKEDNTTLLETEAILLLNYKDYHVNEFRQQTATLKTKTVRFHMNENSIDHMIESLEVMKGEMQKLKEDAENN